MKFIGLIASEEASAAFFDTDTGTLLAASEERFTRIKGQTGFPSNAINWLLKESNSSPYEIDTVLYCHSESVLPGNISSDVLKIQHLLSNSDNANASEALACIFNRYCAESAYNERFSSEAKNKVSELFPSATYTPFDHHECHAYSIYPFIEKKPDKGSSLFLTLDGKGNFCAGSAWIKQQAISEQLTCIYRIPSFVSLGYFYGNATAVLGFKPHRHEGKVTGLASRGSVVENSPLLDLFQVTEDGLQINPDLFLDLYSPFFIDANPGNPPLENLRKLAKIYGRDDFAATVQFALEKAVSELLIFLCRKHQLGNIDLYCAGGIFANVSLNSVISNLPFVNSLAVTPPMGDAGLAIGGIMKTVSEKNTTKNIIPFRSSAYLGTKYSHDQILACIDELNNQDKRFKILSIPDIAKYASDLLLRNKIVGIFSDRMEFGPRALGHRSVFANPSTNQIHHELNRRMNRSEFMPFAPITTDDRASKNFRNYQPGDQCVRFMTKTFVCEEQMASQVPAAVHCDGTARPQVIEEKDDPLLYEFLDRVLGISGLPALINTSFNAHEEPIVESPFDALNSLKLGMVDSLIFNFQLVVEAC